MIAHGSGQAFADSRRKILEFRWEKLRKKILEDCLWQVTKDELEALEACYWLKATGFQEYVHMYEDKKFPVDIHVVLKRHDSLDDDSRHSLIRRLETLNKCAKLLEKTNAPTQNPRFHGNSTQLTRQCSAASFTHIKSPKMLHRSPNKTDNRKRPSSKYGIYNLQQGTEDSTRDDDDVFRVGNEENRLPRTLSFSGTLESVKNESGGTFIACRSTGDVLEYNNSVGFYDNVPFQADDSSGTTRQRSEASTSDSVFDESARTNRGQFLSHMESDDDISSISSCPDYDDNYDGARNETSNITTSNCKVMGSIDSGVPSSPVLRSPSVRRRRVRWHSFQKSSVRESIPASLRIQNLSAGQIKALRKISLLRLTALMERYSMQSRSAWHWTVPKLLRRLKTSENRDKNVFGAPLLTMVQRSGQPLPRSILLSMNFLQRTALKNVGIFRRSGMKSRIEKLKEEIESRNSKLDFESYSPYDIADMLKLYLRELPEPVLTSKLAETFISIYKDIPKELREESMQLAIILMPDENREALQTILAFLNDFAVMSKENQMDYKNLSVCFTPAFFHIFSMKCDRTQNAKRLKRTFSSQKSEKDLEDTTAAQQCLEDLMKSFRVLFSVPEDVMMKCPYSYIEQGDPVSFEQLSMNQSETEDSGYQLYIENCFAGLLQESYPKAKGWVQHSIHDDVEISYKIVKDGYPIRLWKAVVQVNAYPADVLRRFVKERHLWDDEMVHWEYIETVDEQTDIFYYQTQSIAPSIKRDYLTLRSWRSDLNGSCCGCVSTSIIHKVVPSEYGHRATVLADRCLMEPCDPGRCKVTYISRTDLRGKSPRYYNKAVGPWSVYSCVSKIRETFNCGPDGPETNV